MERVSPSGEFHAPALDGIRAMAISFVILAHLGLGMVIPGGFGVTLFFFLSGYLITSLLRAEHAKTGRIDIPAFYLRRTLRIIPPLWITIALAGATIALGWVLARPTVIALTSQLFFFNNYLYLWTTPEGKLPLGIPEMPLWSLGVEEHFYLLFPFVFSALLIRMRPARAAGWCFAVCALVLLIRTATVFSGPGYWYVYEASHTRIDSILWGCALALWNNPALDADAWKPQRRHVALALAILLGCLLYRAEEFRQTLRYSLQGFALLILFSYALHDNGRVKAVLSSAPLALIARYSYSLYLVHAFLFFALEQYLPALHWFPRGIIGVLLSFGYAAAMYALVERPLAQVRKALHHRRSKAAVAA